MVYEDVNCPYCGTVFKSGIPEGRKIIRTGKKTAFTYFFTSDYNVLEVACPRCKRGIIIKISE